MNSFSLIFINFSSLYFMEFSILLFMRPSFLMIFILILSFLIFMEALKFWISSNQQAYSFFSCWPFLKFLVLNLFTIIAIHHYRFSFYSFLTSCLFIFLSFLKDPSTTLWRLWITYHSIALSFIQLPQFMALFIVHL